MCGFEAKNGNKIKYMNIQNVEVEIRVNGRPVRSYNHDGKVFIESREDSQYTISIKNNNWFRVLAVPSIDGISTMNGKKASHSSGGYIIGGYQSFEIKGYRKSMDEVGSFKFSKKGGGYAESKGESKNVGIISVAIFKEKQPVYTYNNCIISGTSSKLDQFWTDSYYNTCANSLNIQNQSNTFDNDTKACSLTDSVQYESARGLSSMSYSAPQNAMSLCKSAPTKDTFDHSTKWGERVSDRVVSGTFEKEALLAEFNIYYASKQGLETLGIDVIVKKEVAFPQGFDNQFCEPPKGW